MIDDDSLTITLSGGSCQGDSDGFAPGLAAIKLHTADTTFEATVDAPDEAVIGSEFSLRLQISNGSKTPMKGVARSLLNSGFVPGSVTQGAIPFRVEPGSAGTIELQATASKAFNTDYWKYASYKSVGVGAEVFFAGYSLFLVKQIKISGE